MIYQTYMNYSNHATKFRRYFDQQMKDPHVAHEHRFVWDFWHVPNEYHFLRTPAFEYFPKKLYEQWHKELVTFGREFLGCHDISPTWLSNYINGCRQEQHRDEPHGPLAFVWSLTPQRKQFTGGDTLIWSESSLFKSHKKAANFKEDLIAQIAPKFNQLVVFDPSYPHGVSEVQGIEDPRDGRLVLHGWFVQPRPFWYGPMTVKQVQKALDKVASSTLPQGVAPQGFVSLKLHINASGIAQKIELLVETLKVDEKLKKKWLKEWLQNIQTLTWPKNKKGTVLTVPFVFS